MAWALTDQQPCLRLLLGYLRVNPSVRAPDVRSAKTHLPYDRTWEWRTFRLTPCVKRR